MEYIFAVAICVVFLTTPAFATDKYFSLNTGAWIPGHTSTVDSNFRQVDISYDAGWGIGGTIGVALDNGLRLENELVYRQATAKGLSDDMWALGWMINAWWDARNSSRFTPYFGGGFGFGRGHVASPGPVDNTGSGGAYQVGVGGDVRLDRQTSLDMGYRYFGISDTSSNGGGSSVDLVGSSIVIGVRYKF